MTKRSAGQAVQRMLFGSFEPGAGVIACSSSTPASQLGRITGFVSYEVTMGWDKPSRSLLESIVAKQDIREARALQEDALVGTPIVSVC